MRKLFSILAATLFATTMFAATAPKATFDFKDQNWNFPTTATTEAKSFVNGDQTIVVSDGFKGMTTSSTDPTIKGVLFGKKNKTISLPAFSFRTEKILVYYVDGAGSSNTKHNIFVGETAVSTEEVGCKVTTEKSYSTFEITEAKRDAGTVYILKVTSDHNMQVSKIEVYEDESTPASVYAPTFDPAAETFEVDVTIALACATEGASIFYTTNGTEPATTAGASTYEYTNPFTITETTTIKAIAVKGADKSAVAEKTYTKLVVNQYEVKEAIEAGLNKGDLIKVRGVVTNMAAKGTNFATYGSLKIYVKDATGAEGEFQLFNCYSLNEAKFETTVPAYDATSADWADFTSVTDADGHTLKVGDTIVAKGKYELYNSTYELQQGCYLVDVKEGTPPTPTTFDFVKNEYVEYTSDSYFDLIMYTSDTWSYDPDNGFSVGEAGYALVLNLAYTDMADVTGNYTSEDVSFDPEYSRLCYWDGTSENLVTTALQSGTVKIEWNSDKSGYVVTYEVLGANNVTYKGTANVTPYDEPEPPTPDTTVEVKIDDALLDNSQTDQIGILGEDATGLWVQIFLYTDDLQGDYTEADFGGNTSIWFDDDNYTTPYKGTVKVVPANNNGYVVTAELLCYDNTLYKITMTVPGDEDPTGIKNVETAQKVIKAIENGQLIINVNGIKYNVNGAIVK